MGIPESPTSSHLPGRGVGVTSHFEALRAMPVVVHNSRIAIAICFIVSIGAAFISICTLLFAFSIFSSGFSLGNLFSFLLWALSAFSIGYMCPWLWKMARPLAAHRVTFDVRGVSFRLGAKKKPIAVFFAWDQVASISHKRAGNAQYYFVQGRDGTEVQFSSWSFFRPRKIARLIAARTGLAIQET